MLEFVKTFGPLTHNGLRGKGEVVPHLIDQAKTMSQVMSLVCGREDGKPKYPNSLTHKFSYLVGRAGLPKVRFHDLRHSHATQLLASGVHPKIVQERLGHSTISVTMDLYSHVSETMQSDATMRLDQAYGRW